MLADPVDAPSAASRQRMGYNPKRIEEHNSSVFRLGIIWPCSCSSLCVGFGNRYCFTGLSYLFYFLITFSD